eukprot:TRINITY_DN6308_c0_g1_i1.p1 TRINITY_DN6308_c0_g1~~TRINITY_DN6308_c0_g1_i1.p1  ORF type:complete len:563 (-),score=225.09 TRINITY_DN6308_c0_g1_i1:325-2013(-)
MEENGKKKRGRTPSPPSRSKEIKTEPKNEPRSLDNSSNNASSSSSTPASEVKKPSSSIADLMANLAAKKKQLEQQLEGEKKEKISNDLLQRAVQVRSAIASVKRDNSSASSTPSSSTSLNPSPSPQTTLSSSSNSSSNSNKSSSINDTKAERDDSDFLSFTPSLSSFATLKVNQKAKATKSGIVLPSERPAAEKKKNLFIDPNIKSAASDRTKRSFHFLNRTDVRIRVDKERGTVPNSADPSAVKTEEDVKVNFALSQEELLAKKPKEPLPEVEWWDKWLLESESYADLDKEGGVKWGEINHYVEHPVPIKAPGDSEENAPTIMFLTPKETKKLRKQKRAEREKERQERVIMGLEQAPAPKVKLSNLALVLGAESSANPTAIEKEVRRQTEERIAAHDARNAKNKLSKEERKQKKKDKLMADAKHSTRVAVFRVKDLSHPQHKFKVDATAKEHFMTGCAVISPLFSMVVVEGSEVSVRKFKKLMMNRIDWNKPKEVEGVEEAPQETPKDNVCDLIWEGTLLKANFQNFRFESHPTEAEVRRYLNNRWSEHYWDMCKNYEKEE